MKRILVISALSFSALILAACGGGGGASAPQVSPPDSGASAPAAVQNSIPVVVDDGPMVNGQPLGAVNVAYVSVKVCAPGSASACVTVDHVMVDTGSSGLRLLASAVGNSVALPTAVTSDQQPLAECTRFAVGYTWGAVRRADVRLGGEAALNIPVQIISDPSVAAAPTDCSSAGDPMNDVPSLAANGILGIGHAVADCGRGSCAATGGPVTYYTCSGAACTGVALPSDQQVRNPVAAFAADNNGSLLQLPAIDAGGAINVNGTLVFGIGTQPDNALGTATVLTLEPNSFTFVTTFQGQRYVGFIDSGSNFDAFTDSSIPLCTDAAGFYCPASTLNLTAINTGFNGQSVAVDFSVANFESLATALPDGNAANDVAVTSHGGTTLNDGTFDWGLPFFYGRSVYTAIEGRMAAGTVGPWVGFEPLTRPTMTIEPVSAASSAVAH